MAILNAVRQWQQPSPGWGKGEYTAHGVGAHTLKSDGAKIAIKRDSRRDENGAHRRTERGGGGTKNSTQGRERERHNRRGKGDRLGPKQLCGSCPPHVPNVWLALTALLLLDSHLGAALCGGGAAVPSRGKNAWLRAWLSLSMT